jgi:hypothetical protein
MERGHTVMRWERPQLLERLAEVLALVLAPIACVPRSSRSQPTVDLVLRSK